MKTLTGKIGNFEISPGDVAKIMVIGDYLIACERHVKFMITDRVISSKQGDSFEIFYVTEKSFTPKFTEL